MVFNKFKEDMYRGCIMTRRCRRGSLSRFPSKIILFENYFFRILRAMFSSFYANIYLDFL